MSPAAIPPTLAPRLGALLRMLGSDQEHEALGAVRALRRTLGAAGLSLHELADAVERPAERTVYVEREPPRARRGARPGDVVLDAGQQARLAVTLDHALDGARLSPWERQFAHSILGRLRVGRGRLSAKQGETLGRLLDKLGEGSAWV